MDKTFVIFRILLKRKEVVFITPLHSNYNLNMMMMKFILATVILILIQIALNYYRDFANLKAKIESEKQLFVKLLLVMIVKWQ